MKSLTQGLRAACLSGGVASLASTLALAWLGRRDTGHGFAALNAPSHWIWGDAALQQDRGSLRYTATGLAVHHLASVFWAALYESACRHDRPRSAARLAWQAPAVAAVAAWVDLRCVPPRFSPGFERRLSSRSLVLVYAAFAAGIALGARHTDRSLCVCASETPARRSRR